MSKRVGKTQLLTGLPTLVRKKKSSKDEDLCETCTSVDYEKIDFSHILSQQNNVKNYIIDSYIFDKSENYGRSFFFKFVTV